MLKLSPFRINMYRKCPRQYKFHCVDNLELTQRNHLVIANNVHGALRDFFSVNPEERNFELLEDFLRNRWFKKNKKSRTAFKTKEEEKEYGERALTMLKNFCQHHDTKIQPFHLEKDLKMLVNDVLLFGRVDRIDRLADNSLHIIDYKTGKKAELETADDIQLMLYAVIIKKNWPKEAVSKASYFYLELDKVVPVKISEELLEKAYSRIMEIVGKIKEDTEFAPLINNLCRDYCDFLELCPLKEKILTPSS